MRLLLQDSATISGGNEGAIPNAVYKAKSKYKLLAQLMNMDIVCALEWQCIEL